MNKFGKRIVTAILLGGAVILGVALNSTNSMAAELDAVEPESQVESVTTDESEEVETEPQLSNVSGDYGDIEIEDAKEYMKHVVEYTEGAAANEEGYLNQAQEAIEYNDLSDEEAEKLLEYGHDELESARTGEEIFNAVYGEIEYAKKDEIETDKKEFVDAATEFGLGEIANKVETAEGNQEKLDIVKETEAQMYSIYDEETNGKAEERRDTSIEIYICEGELEELQAELDSIRDRLVEIEYEELYASKDQYHTESYIDMWEEMELWEINERIEDAKVEEARLREIFNDKDAKYQKVIDDIKEMLYELEKTNILLQERANKLKYDSTSSSDDVSAYEEVAKKYDESYKIFSTQSSDLPNARVEYDDASTNLSSQSKIVTDLENEVSQIKEKYSEQRREYREYFNDLYERLQKEYKEISARIPELESSITKKEKQITTLKKKEAELTECLDYWNSVFVPLRDAAEKYEYILTDFVYFDELRDRTYAAHVNTLGYYNDLVDAICEYNKSGKETDGAAVIEKMDKIEKELANDTAEIAKNAKVIKGAQEDKTTTILAVNNERTAAETNHEVAKNNNQKIHKYYDQLKKALDKAGEEYRKLLEDLDDTYDEEAFAAAQEKYMTLIKLMKQAKELLNQSDKDLEQATNNYNEVVVAYDDFNKDVTYITDAREIWDSGYRIVTFFEGYVKGNSAAVNESSSFQDILNNIWGYVGTFEGTVYDIYGNTVDRFKQDLNVRLI